MTANIDLSDPPLFGMEWNETDGFPEDLRNVIATITCLSPTGLVQIGSGVIIQGNGNRATVLTAAHVITEGVKAFQNTRSRKRAHPTTPADFLQTETVSAATTSLRVIVQNMERRDACRVGLVLWDEAADLAVLMIVPQDDDVTDFFQWHMKLSARDPAVGDLVVVGGYCEFENEVDAVEVGRGVISHRAICRIGKMTMLHPDGTTWVRSPCIDATMPTFSGMSGAPAFIDPGKGGEPQLFGLLSQSIGSS